MAHQDPAGGDLPSADSWNEPVTTGSQLSGLLQYLADDDRWVWSSGVAELYGYDHRSQQPSIELLLRHTHLEDRSRVAGELQRMVRGERVNCRHRVIDRAGDLHWVIVICDRSEEGPRAFSASGHVVDVTDAVQDAVTAAMSELATSRAVIEQAKGVLMATHGISADEAFDRLVQRSQAANIKVRAVASEFLDAVSGKPAETMRAVC